METIFPAFIFVSIVVVFSVDANRKRREFLKKYRSE